MDDLDVRVLSIWGREKPGTLTCQENIQIHTVDQLYKNGFNKGLHSRALLLYLRFHND